LYLKRIKRRNVSYNYDGFTFRVDRILKNNDISWRCTNNKSKCKARVRTDGESKVVMSAMSEHNHDMNEREIESKQLRVMAKRKASDDISARPSKIIRQELQKLDESNLQTKDLKNVAFFLFVDGTFKYCTKFFHQLYTIHGCKNGHYVPLVFALLPAKTVMLQRFMDKDTTLVH
jgi:uncharacterized protein YlaI